MSLRILVDAQLPPSLAAALRSRGHEAVHAADIGLLAATDTTIWNQAVALSAVLMTKDRDFTLLRAARQTGPAILWVRLGNIGNKTLIAKILNSLPSIEQACDRGDGIIELR